MVNRFQILYNLPTCLEYVLTRQEAYLKVYCFGIHFCLPPDHHHPYFGFLVVDFGIFFSISLNCGVNISLYAFFEVLHEIRLKMFSILFIYLKYGIRITQVNICVSQMNV